MSTSAIDDAALIRFTEALHEVSRPLVSRRPDLEICVGNDVGAGPSPTWQSHRASATMDISHGGGPVRVTVFVREGEVPMDEVRDLALAASRVAEAEEDRQHLFEELTLSYESLHGVYAITSSPDLFMDPDKAFAAILERAVAYQPGFAAVLWLLRGDDLVPVQWRNTIRPHVRKSLRGLVGTAVREERGVVESRYDRGRSLLEGEMELERASRVAVAPLSIDRGVLGALQVWHEEPGVLSAHYMSLLTALATQAAMILDHSRLRNEMVSTARLRQEMTIAATIQQRLLLGTAPTGLERLDVAALTVPSRHVDGDFYDFFLHGGEVLDVLIGDVMGKGIPAAMVAAAVKSHMLRYAATDGFSGPNVRASDPDAIVNRVHAAITRDLVELECFVTAAYARFEPRCRRLTYIDCGHTPTLHYREERQSVDSLRREWGTLVNLPLGMHPKTRYQSTRMDLETGDIVVFYSDGMTEAVAADGSMYGQQALAESLVRHRQLSAREIATALRDEVVSFAAVDGVKDDLTCVVVKVLPEPASAPAEIRCLRVLASLDHLTQARDFVIHCCEAVRFLREDPACAYNVVLAANECISNVMRHAYEPENRLDVEIRAALRPDSIEFQISDEGRSFDPTQARDPELSRPRDGGFGIFLVRKIMDEFVYERTSGGRNRVTLIKRFHPGGSPCN